MTDICGSAASPLLDLSADGHTEHTPLPGSLTHPRARGPRTLRRHRDRPARQASALLPTLASSCWGIHPGGRRWDVRHARRWRRY